MSSTDDPDKRASRVKTNVGKKTAPGSGAPAPTVVDPRGGSGGVPPTVIDPPGGRGSHAGGKVPGTVLDPGSMGGPWVAARLVPPVAGQYEIVRELDSGAEAHVLLVRSKAGRQLVYKTYHERNRVTPETGERISRASKSIEGKKHLVEIVKCGEYDSRWWELLEYCELGSLRSHLRKVDPTEAIGQLAAALTYVHGKDLDLVHRDLKPENVLVRSLTPLNLVLGDFGLVYDMKPGTVVFGKAERTPGYEPPETFHGDKALITRKTDWWSLGMIAAEMVLGRHLLAPPGGSLSTDPDEIKKLIWDGVDVSEIKDPKWNRLCRGLLTRKRDDRWDGRQVSDWIKGGSPAVADDAPDDHVIVPVRDPAKVRRPWAFNGKQYTSAADLAIALQKAWPAAADLLAPSATKSTQVKALQEFCAELKRDVAVRALAEEVTPSNSIDRRLAIVLADLHPALEPEWRGMRIDRAGLEREALLTVEGRARGTGRLDELRVSGVLGVWPMLSGCDGHVVLADRWVTQCQQFSATIDAEASSGAGALGDQAIRQANAWLLLTSLESAHLSSLAERHAGLFTDVGRRQDWYRRIHDRAKSGRDAVAMLVSICYSPVAIERQNAKEAEDRRLAAAEAERRDAAELQRRQQEVATRRLATQARFKKWSSTFLAMGVMALWLGAGLIASTIKYGFANWFADGFNTTAEFMNSVRTWHLGNVGRPFQDLDWINASNSGQSPLPLAFGVVLCVAAVALFVSSRLAEKGRGLGDDGRLAPATKRAAMAGSLTAAAGVVALAPWALIGLIFVAIAVAAVMLIVIVFAIANS